MFAVHQLQNAKRARYWLLGIGAAAMLFLGVALFWRGPLIEVHPEMAETPIAMPGKAEIYVMRYEVSVAEWNLCFEDGACQLALRVRSGQSPAETPATGLSYIDVTEYLAWINEKTGHDYRLPTVAEWEHMAKPVLPEEPDPIFTDPALTWASAYLLGEGPPRAIRPRGSFSASPAGIFDLDGNVWEWTQDCYAGTAGVDTSRCPAFFVAGEHIAAIPFPVRDPARGGCAVGAPPAHLGVRLVTESRYSRS